MLSPDAAWRRIVAAVEPVAGVETIPTHEALGRIAAAAVRAPIDLPPFRSSAMDGYAVCAAAIDGPPPIEWDVVGQSAAGHPSNRRVGAGEALRIFTGAMMPEGADAVVLQEDVERRRGAAVANERPKPGQHVRARGHDVARGAPIVAAGDRLDGYALAWLTACGVARVEVKRLVRVAVFATGDELVDPGTPLGPGQIYDSNRFALLRLMQGLPAAPRDMGRLPDARDATAQALTRAAEESDVIIASGGVSVGEADFVKAVVEERGTLDFWRIALKPGKPLAVGKVAAADFFGLPGNPVSTIITFLLFVVPAILARAGGRPQAPVRVPAALGRDIRHTRGRREYQRGRVEGQDGRLVVAPTGDQGSNRLATFSGANCLIEVPEHRAGLSAGEAVQVLMLADSGRLV